MVVRTVQSRNRFPGNWLLKVQGGFLVCKSHTDTPFRSTLSRRGSNDIQSSPKQKKVPTALRAALL